MKQESLNSFGGGLNKDLNNLATPAEVLTDCLNGTIITYNGNEFSLQNDMGNAKVGTAALPDGFIPVGMKEHGGIIYVASYNPKDKVGQIGCFPSPQQIFTNEEKSKINIDLKEFYFENNPQKPIYNKSTDVVLKTNNIRQIINPDIILHPGDIFVVQAELNSAVLQAIKDQVLILRPAILTNFGKIEYLNVNKLDKFTHKTSDITVESWICPTIDEEGNALTIEDILSSKSDKKSKYKQVLRSSNSGKLIIIAELNTIQSVNYNIDYNRDLVGSDYVYGFTIQPFIKYNINLENSIGMRYCDNDRIIVKRINTGQVGGRDLSYKTQLSGDEISVDVVPFTKYGLENNYLKQYSLTKEDVKNPKDELKSFVYFIKESSIELQIEYLYMNFYDNDIETVINIYDYQKPKKDGLVYSFSGVPKNFSGSLTIDLPFKDRNGEVLFEKNKIYVCEIVRRTIYESNTEEKQFYVYIYATPLYDGVNMVTMNSPVEVNCILKHQPKIINNIKCSYNNTRVNSLEVQDDYQYFFPVKYENDLIVNLENSNYIQSAVIGNYEYDWNTYFIGDRNVTTNIKDMQAKFYNSESSETLNILHSEFEPNVRADLKAPNITPTENGFKIEQDFIVDYEIKQLNKQSKVNWRPYLNSTYKDPDKLKFSYVDDKLHASVIGDHGGIAAIEIDSTSDAFYPKYRNDDNEIEKLKASGKVQKYFGNGFPLDEASMRDDLTYMLDSIENDGTIGIVAGAFKDEASMRVTAQKNDSADTHDIWLKSNKINYKSDNRSGNGHYNKSNDIDAHDNWMLACMKSEATKDCDSTWVFLNMISKRSDKGYHRIDSFIKQLLSQIIIWDNTPQEIAISEYYNSPLSNYISYKDNGDINIQYQVDITSDIQPKNGEWDKIGVIGVLPTFTIKIDANEFNYSFNDIYNYVYEYINTNGDTAYLQNTEDSGSSLDKNKIYIMPQSVLDEQGYFVFNLDDVSKINEDERLTFIKDQTPLKGMNVEELNIAFKFKDGKLYTRPIHQDSLPYLSRLLAVSQENSKLDNSALVLLGDVLCPEISVIKGDAVH